MTNWLNQFGFELLPTNLNLFLRRPPADKTGQPLNGLTRPSSAYDKLMKNIKPDAAKKSEEVSLDANKILDELPILNFMRSNTLMFNQ